MRIMPLSGALFLSLFPLAANATPVRQLSINERVEAQRAIDRVYHSHLRGTGRTFEQAVTPQLIDRKVNTYLKQSAALAEFWNTPVTAQMLRAEADRIGRNTRFPERLGEIRSALGSDSLLVQETLVRATLVDRLARGFFDRDERIHGAARAEAGQIHADLLAGTMNPTTDHPRRTVLTFEPPLPEVEALPAPPHAPVGEVGPMVESPSGFSIDVTLSVESGVTRVAHYLVPKVSWETWWADHEAQFDGTLVQTVADAASLLDSVQSSQSAEPCLQADKWENGALDNVPDARYQHVSVWTGTEMIVWGGKTSVNVSATASRYDPLTDSWRGVSLSGAPPMAYDGTAVWTGTEMIVWGGISDAAARAAGRYDPVSDTWSPISTVGEPGAKSGHSAIWTGTEMIVWGGQEGGTATATGARYDPATDTWLPVSPVVLAARLHHTAVWTDSEMIIWGGEPDNTQNQFLSSGARYDPFTDTWMQVSSISEPSARTQHSAVWANGEMIIWGGMERTIGLTLTSSGARYDPLMDAWTPMTVQPGLTPIARRSHSAVWTGTRMVVWGGSTSPTEFGSPTTGTGGLYDPATDTWQPTSQINAPSYATFRTAVWTGSLMIVWGGAINSGGFFSPALATGGGRYDPSSNSWTATASTQSGFIAASGSDTIVWTGTEMIAWSREGGRYDPMTDSWRAVSRTGAPTARFGHAAVWTGDEMVVWGGNLNPGYLRDGGRYDPVSDTWRPTSIPTIEPRAGATAVWTGDEMIVWGGGVDRFFFNYRNGARYNPQLDSWQGMSSLNAPPFTAFGLAAVWTGKEMIIWGGFTPETGGDTDLGARYDPKMDRWTPLSALPAGQARSSHTAIWTGDEMIIVGGRNQDNRPDFRAAWIYNLAADSWTPLDPPDPSFNLMRQGPSAVWTGAEMLVWGGPSDIRDTAPADGIIYNRAAETWSFMSQAASPLNRGGQGTLWTGSSMLIWGGGNGAIHILQTGGRYIRNSGVCNSAPVAVAGADISGCGSVVTLDGSASSDVDSSPNTNDDIVLFEWFENYGTPTQTSLGSGEILEVALPIGEHEITLRVTDTSGQTDLDDVHVSVTLLDLTPPVITAVASPAQLWPPNHHMVEVTVALTVVDDCGSSTASLVSVSSSEPDDAPGGWDGSTTGDIDGVDPGTADTSFLLRAERDIHGDGRTYTILYQAVDSSGNVSQLPVLVVAPHDMNGITHPLNLNLREGAAGTVLEWSPVPWALFYNIIRGDLANIRDSGNAIDLGNVQCIESGSLDSSTIGSEDAALPAPGRAFFYLVEFNDGWTSSYGEESVLRPRKVGSGDCN